MGAEPPHNLLPTTAIVKPILPYNGADENGEQDCFFILFPVFVGVMARQKFRLSMV
ncbi:MAG: hypothetical protein FWB80_14520 [Defluviitaleaceae bacterium]|nr:hypothetical protein [Defluviitaleaceae bacterium]